MKGIRRLLWLVPLLSTSALADSVNVEITNRVLIGKGVPMVHVRIQEPIAGFRLKLKRSDGATVNIKGGGLPGQTRDLQLSQPEGKFGYEGELTVNLPDGSTDSMPLQFEAEILGPLRLTLDRNDVDVANRRVSFKLNRAARKAQVKVLMDTGRVALEGDVNFNGEPPGTLLEVRWPEAPGKVMMISLRGYDVEGFYDGVELFPWQVDIPHEDVNFDTGKWEIRADEQGKLDKSLQEISDAVGKYGKYAQIKLYIAGHTDTVGSAESNKTLSVNRARSIGAYFRKRGLRIPIFYDGFGESALQVSTVDEKDEPKNRRAEYIIAIEQPSVKNASVAPRWQKL